MNDNGNVKWAADEERIPGGYKSLTTCALNSNDCYLIDFHIPLEINGQRTALGNVDNDYDLGWQKGSFFMYDPEVHTPPLPESELEDNDETDSGNKLTSASCWAVAFVLAWYVH